MYKKLSVITEFVSILRVQNKAGFRLECESRYSAAYIFLLRGKIRLSQHENQIIADEEHPVYIPSGAYYINECLDDADSIVLNFNDMNTDDAICSLYPMEKDKLIIIFNRICALKGLHAEYAQAEIFSLIYKVISESIIRQKDTRSELIAPAIERMELQFYDSKLNVEELAKCCHVSKTYLNRIFGEMVGMSPFRYLTYIRMEHAQRMLKENYPVGEVARIVGYSDLYQFSRAYKRYYGISPKKHMQESKCSYSN